MEAMQAKPLDITVAALKLNGHINAGYTAHLDENNSSDYDNNGQRHDKDLLDIHPFLEMATAAYKDDRMADKFSFIRDSRLIKDVRDPLKLALGIKTDTEVHVCVLEDGSLAFAFRGTEFEFKDLKSLVADFMTDMMRVQVPVELHNASDKIAYQANPQILAHKGFQLAFRSVTKSASPNDNIRLMAESLGAHAQNVHRVICIGHSLGGALATLCAQWCRYVAYPTAQVWCVTMGSPRVGNTPFADDFNKNVVTKGRSYRVVNKGDVIPNVPYIGWSPKSLILSAYKHVDGFMHLMEDPEKKTITPKRDGGRSLLHMRSMKDHDCAEYKRSVSQVIAVVPHFRFHRSYSLPPI